VAVLRPARRMCNIWFSIVLYRLTMAHQSWKHTDPTLVHRSTSFNVDLIKDHATNIHAQPHGEVRRQATPANDIRSHNFKGRRTTSRAHPWCRPTTAPQPQPHGLPMALVPCWTSAMAAHDDKRTRARWQAPGRTTITSRVGSALLLLLHPRP
jgi:hypothetical protein